MVTKSVSVVPLRALAIPFIANAVIVPRELGAFSLKTSAALFRAMPKSVCSQVFRNFAAALYPVSYTHLTLPTMSCV